MMKQRRNHRFLCFSLVLVLGALLPACGGGGGDGGGDNNMGPLIARFTPAATPGTISMAGSAAGASFSIQVQVTNVNDFFGAGFRVTFDSASAQFVGFSSAGSFLTGPATDFDAVINPANAGEVIAYGTIQDLNQSAGIDVAGTATLMTLNFQATAATSSNAFAFGTAANRVVTVCPTMGGACSDLTEPPLTWTGGTMSASR
jgi:hypothetical protein